MFSSDKRHIMIKGDIFCNINIKTNRARNIIGENYKTHEMN